MSQIIIGSITLSLIHALIPSHWLPLVTIGKAQGWDNARLMRTTAFAGLAHTVSTTLIGLSVSFASVQIAHRQWLISERVVPAILLAWGIWFLAQHNRRHAYSHIRQEQLRGRTYPQVLVSLVVMMFLSPCLEINAYFLSAGIRGLHAILTIVFIYNALTISGMLLISSLTFKSLNRLNLSWAQYEHLVTGITLIFLAAFSFFVKI